MPIAVLISIYYALWGPLQRGSRVTATVSNIVELGVFAAVLVWIGRWRISHLLGRHRRWLSEEGAPDPVERVALARLPLTLAGEMFGAMSVISVLVGLGSLVASRTWQDPVRAVVGLLLSGSIFAALVYLVSEQALRPLFARALREPTPPSPVGVERRLLIGWALGSGIPLLFLVTMPLRAGPGHLLPLIVPLIFMSMAGLAIGGITTAAVARSVALPLRSVRAGLKAVEAGDLDATLAIDDPGDLGELQRGFNDMVTGLRERRALEDLFGRYVGRDLAARVFESGPELGGELRTVSVLFVDVIGSTAMAEAMRPEQVVSTMNSFYRVVTDVMDHHGGWIDKFEGDGAMCVFGAPIVQPDHSDRALAAAIDLNAGLTGIGIDAGIGIAAGSVVAGTVGTSDRFEYTVLGRPVNEAARVTDAAKQQRGRVLASAAVLELATTAAAEDWQPAGETHLRGIERTVQLYRPRRAP